MEKRQNEIKKLKTDWEQDPIWDIETTLGFEDYYDELLTYRKQKELEWNLRNKENVLKQRKNQIASRMSTRLFIAKDIMCAFIAHNHHGSAKITSELALEYADELIKQEEETR